ncbi:MAG: L,D-transpeptidase family protein [Bacteroidota bacterium]|nr:L,D-transpeptidase family protein [Bacteroidota bacterium]
MSQSFKEKQMQFPHVKIAFSQKSTIVDSLLLNHGIHKNEMNIFLRAFKNEKRLELWGKNKIDKKFVLITAYPFCEVSSGLGPKRKEGDGQIPEGLYTINHFNPESSFYLSLGVSYPNKSDRILGVQGRLGGEIYIHGNCVTIGCIPITDDLIKELYVFAVEARNNGQEEIPVHIFPTTLDDNHLNTLKEYAKSDSAKIEFWKNLAQVFNQFEMAKVLNPVSIDSNGRYVIR